MEKQKVVLDFCSQAPYCWANGTLDNPARDSNPESTDDYTYTQDYSRREEPATFCSEDRCSAIEPLKHFSYVKGFFKCCMALYYPVGK